MDRCAKPPRTRVRQSPCVAPGGVRNRKQPDWAQILTNYRERISEYPRFAFEDFEDAYVSDYKLNLDSEHSHVPIFMSVCRDTHRINVLGVVPEDKRRGSRVYARDDFPSNAKVIYIGPENHLTNKTLSRFSLSKADAAYITPN